MALTIDSTTPTIDTTFVTIDRAPLSTIAITSVAFSASLQAPITLSNPTGSLVFASDSGSGIHQANPIPAQGALSLVGVAVRLALAMKGNAGSVSIGSAASTVISGLVTPRSPVAGSLAANGASPTLTIASGAAPLTFPRVMLVGIGGDQSYGSNATTGYPAWTTAAAGSAANTAIQTIGAYDIAILSGVFEGWDTSGARDRDNLTQALGKKATTYTITKNTARPTQVFYYEIMNATVSGNPYAQWQTLVDANNWYLYESAGGVGTKTPAGGGQLFINYSAAWPGSIGSAGAGSSICGTNYGTTSSGSPTGAQGPARAFGNYAAIKLLMRGYAGDSRFSFNVQMGSPNAAGIFLDEAFAALDGAGTVPDSSLDGITIAPGSQQGGGFPGLDTPQSVMARGIHNFFDQLQTMVNTYGGSGNVYYNFANFGQYANKYQFGTTTLTVGLENTLHGGLLENAVGAGTSAWECFQVGNTNTGNTLYPSGWPNLLANYYQGMDFCQSPKLVGLGTKLPSLPDAQGNSITASWPVGAGTTLTTVTTGTALEYQLMRYGLCTTLMDDGYFAVGITGYDWSRLRWYDEYGDDSLTQVNVKRGYLGTPLTPRPTSPQWAQGPMGVWWRAFTGGAVALNPRGNGAQTVTLSQTYQALTGTQQPTVNNGAVVNSITIPDGDGRILILPISSFAANSGFSISAPSGASNGSVITVTGPPGSFGTKPFSAKPLFWAPFDISGSPSSLGRITSLMTSGPVGSNSFTWQNSGGPSNRGCMASPTTTGAAGVWNWAQGIVMSQWSGWSAADPHGGNNGYFANDFGQSIYVYRRFKKNFGHLDLNATLSYNGIGSYNLKNFRIWSTIPTGSASPSTLVAPDIYMGQSDQILLVEGTPVTVTPAAAQDYPSGGGSGQGQLTTNAVVSADGIANTWFAEEIITTSNSSNTVADANFTWRCPAAPVQGPFQYGSMYQFPTTTYHLIGYQFLNAAQGQTLAGNLRGTMTLIFPMHYVMDGTAGSSGHTALPAGLQIFYSQVYVDDSLCRVVATNSATWGSETTDPQIQIPVVWGDTGVSFSAYDLPVGWYVYIVNSANVAKKVGQRIA